MNIKSIIVIILTFASTSIFANYSQFASCKGHTIDGESLLVTIKSHNSISGKAQIKLDILGQKPLYSYAKTEIPNDDIELRIFKNRFKMDFLLSDENSTYLDISLDGKTLAKDVKCFVNSSEHWPRHSLHIDELKKLAYKYANAIAKAMNSELDPRCVGFAGISNNDQINFNIPFGELDEEYGECGDPHHSIDVMLYDDGNLASVHYIDA